MKYRADVHSLFYYPAREDAESAFNSLVAIGDAITKAKTADEARKRLKALLRHPQHKTTKEFIRRILPLHEDRMNRAIQTAIRRVFTSTHHYEAAITNRTNKARAKEKRP